MSLFFKAKEATKLFLFDYLFMYNFFFFHHHNIILCIYFYINLSIFQYFFKAKILYIKCFKIKYGVCWALSFCLFLLS